MSRRTVFAGRLSGGATATSAGFSKGCYVTPDLMLIEYQAGSQMTPKQKDGMGWIFFRSKREAKCWITLRHRERAGEIQHLQRQIKWELHAPTFREFPEVAYAPTKITSYTADFVFEEMVGNTWTRVVADAKGWPNDTYPLKCKWMKAEYGIEIREL